MDGRLVSGGDDEEETMPPSNVRRLLTLPPELDLPDEDGGALRRRNPLANGLRHHNSDESDYRLRDRLLGSNAVSGGYTSLRDLLPSTSASSPTALAASWPPHEGGISIRNRLVKQAAYAYLQPMGASQSPGSARGRGLLRGLCCGADGCAGFVLARLMGAVRGALGCALERLGRKGGDKDR